MAGCDTKTVTTFFQPLPSASCAAAASNNVCCINKPLVHCYKIGIILLRPLDSSFSLASIPSVASLTAYWAHPASSEHPHSLLNAWSLLEKLFDRFLSTHVQKLLDRNRILSIPCLIFCRSLTWSYATGVDVHAACFFMHICAYVCFFERSLCPWTSIDVIFLIELYLLFFEWKYCWLTLLKQYKQIFVSPCIFFKENCKTEKIRKFPKEKPDNQS